MTLATHWLLRERSLRLFMLFTQQRAASQALLRTALSYIGKH